MVKKPKSFIYLTYDEFIASNLNSAASESYLRRCLEAIFDIGRHILAKTGNFEMAGEYKSIANGRLRNK